MPKETEVTRIYKWKPFASIPIGRPNNRWEDEVKKGPADNEDQELEEECIE
jgi:hypothetical protein